MSRPADSIGFFHRSIGVGVVGILVHWKRCFVSWGCRLHRGQFGDLLFVGSILFLYDIRKGDLFVRS